MRNNLFIIAIILSAAACVFPGKKDEAHSTLPVCISDTLRDASSVYLTPDEKNNPVISWCETDHAGRIFFYLSFLDIVTGKFYPAINIPVEQNASLHEEGMPKVAIKGDGSIVAVYETASPTKENQWAGAIHYIQSFDKGKSWSQPRCVHGDTTAGKSRSFASVARLSNGEIGACWLDAAFDYKKGGRPVKFASTSGTGGFKNEILIDSVACECCRTAIGSDGKGDVSVIYRDILNDSIRDMSVSSSTNNGQTFSRPVSFSGDRWTINGCPHNGPSVAISGSDIYASWFTGGHEPGLYYGKMGNAMELTIKQLVSSQGRFIQLCLLPDGNPAMAYNEPMQENGNSYSKIVLNKIVHDKIFTADISTKRSMAGYPVLRPAGNDRIVVAWSDSDRIYYAVVSTDSIDAPAQRPTANPFLTQKPLSAMKLASSKDPVCGMSLSGSPLDTALFKVNVYGFCSATCKKKFAENPRTFTAHVK